MNQLCCTCSVLRFLQWWPPDHQQDDSRRNSRPEQDRDQLPSLARGLPRQWRQTSYAATTRRKDNLDCEQRHSSELHCGAQLQQTLPLAHEACTSQWSTTYVDHVFKCMYVQCWLFLLFLLIRVISFIFASITYKQFLIVPRTDSVLLIVQQIQLKIAMCTYIEAKYFVSELLPNFLMASYWVLGPTNHWLVCSTKTLKDAAREGNILLTSVEH